MEVIVEETTNSVALDYDYSEQLLFWTDEGDETIKRYVFLLMLSFTSISLTFIITFICSGIVTY